MSKWFYHQEFYIALETMRNVQMFHFFFILIHSIRIAVVNTRSNQYYIPDVVLFTVSEPVTTVHVSVRGGAGECALRCLDQRCYTWVYDSENEVCSMYKTARTSTDLIWNTNSHVKLFRGTNLFPVLRCVSEITCNIL